MQWCRLGSSHSVPSFPWYIGMGWTVGIQACSSGNLPLLPFVNWNVSGTDQYVLTLPLRPNYGAMQWDTQVLLDVRRQCWTCVEDTYTLSVTHTHTYVHIHTIMFHTQGKTYYYHVITRKSQWTRPTEKDADGSVTMELASSDEVKVRTVAIIATKIEG